MKKAFLTFIVSVVFMTSAARAQHGGDIGLTISGGNIVTNLLSGSTFEPTRVFGAELGEDFPNYANEPGFDTAHPGAFQAGSHIGFNILDSLRKWDGSDFDAISPEQMTIDFGIEQRQTPTSPDVVPGFSLLVASDGGWHRHLGYTLGSPASDGVYLLKLELFSDQTLPVLGKASPFYIVFNQNDESAHDDAIDYVQSNLVPEPGGMALLGIATLLSVRRRN